MSMADISTTMASEGGDLEKLPAPTQGQPMKRLSLALLSPLLFACAQARPVQSGSGFTDGWVLYPPLSAAILPYREAEGCPPPGWDKATLEALKADGFEIADARA
jgi:hypothetical protein